MLQRMALGSPVASIPISSSLLAQRFALSHLLELSYRFVCLLACEVVKSNTEHSCCKSWQKNKTVPVGLCGAFLGALRFIAKAMT